MGCDSQFHSPTFTFLYPSNQPCLLNCIHGIIHSLIRYVEIAHLFSCHPHWPFVYSLHTILFLPPCFLGNCNECLRSQQKCPVFYSFLIPPIQNFIRGTYCTCDMLCSYVVIFLICFFLSGVFLWSRCHLCDVHCCIHSIPQGAWHTVGA